MRFIVVHKLAVYLLVATSALTLTSSGQIPLTINLLFFGLLVLSWFWEPPDHRTQVAERRFVGRFERFNVAWNIATLAMLVWTVVDIVSVGGAALSGIYFVLFLTINKLFNRRLSADYQQLHVLSFLQIVAASVLNSQLSYGVLFLLYVVFSTWALVLFHLKREMEQNYLLKYADSLEGRPVRVRRVLNSRRLVNGRFLLATSLVSLVIFAGAAAAFALFPRIGLGMFQHRGRSGVSMSGFSDTVELGSFGTIKSDKTVVMRIEFDDPNARHRLRPYWRGLTFDLYDGYRWSKSRGAKSVPPQRDGRFIVGHRTPGSDAVRQRIYLEPMPSRVVFGLSKVSAIKVTGIADDFGPLRVDAFGDLTYRQANDFGFRYLAFSDPEPVPTAALEAPIAAYRAQQTRGAISYLQLPRDLDPRIPALARRLASGAASVGEIIDRIESHLKHEYQYTLELGRDPRLSPLADFLFVQRKGHCEYFATAMTILLRSVGIAARNVNGFVGGTWNAYGGYLAVSQADAHSWVEVQIGRDAAGLALWQTRDPTPSASGPPRPAGAWARLQQFTDSLRMRWYKHVIEYDLRDQAGLVKGARAAWKSAFGSDGDAPLRGAVRWLLGALLLLALALAFRPHLWRRLTNSRLPTDGREPPSVESVAVARLFEAMVGRYTRAGFPRAAHVTAREYLRSLQTAEAPGLEVAQAVVAVYEGARYGGALPTSGAIRSLEAALGRVVS